MRKASACAFVALYCLVQAGAALAHGMAFTTPIAQPASPLQLKDCYLGTDFMFGDPKLVSEETKLQLSADLDRPVPAQYQIAGLRFEFGRTEKHSADIVVFTGTGEHAHDVMAAPVGLDPSGYLPRVPSYEDSRCGVDFVASFDGAVAWFDAASSIVACPGKPQPIVYPGDVWLTALELLPNHTDAVFLLTGKGQSAVSWQLEPGSVRTGSDDGFGRVVAPLATSKSGTYVLRYGPSAQNLSQEVCFHAFRP